MLADSGTRIAKLNLTNMVIPTYHPGVSEEIDPTIVYLPAPVSVACSRAASEAAGEAF
jgi:hypothetical protein